ncbi:MAG: replicative DNA helicase [Saprospiraceae bacterium]|jgi:replicative DNA helicase
MASNVESLRQSPRLPPQSTEAEQSLLGGLMLESRHFDEVSNEIDSDDFYNQNHTRIYVTIQRLLEQSQPVDVVTVSEELERNDELERIGGLAYLGTLANNTPSTANIVTYSKIIRERSILRKLINASTDIADSAYNLEGRKPREVLDRAEQAIFNISETDGRKRDGFQTITNLVAKSVDRIEALNESGSSITGISTGYAKLDDKTSGLQRGDLIVVAGRPSMGKTSFCMNLAEYAAIEQGMKVAVFSMEMPGESLATRLISSLGRVNSSKLRSGQLSDEDWPRISNAIRLLNEAKIHVDDSAGLTPIEIRSRARRLARELGGLDMIVIDYLQLMQSSESNENRATEISQMTRSLKMLAKELDLPLIILSQLNRSLEQRPDKRPVMSDLRESGAIEQDADVIFFIYRDEVYDDESNDKGIAEIIIGKQRNGPIGKVKLAFIGEFTRFENLAPADFESFNN